MSTLHVLLPSLQNATAPPAFRAWIARGNRLPNLPDARDATLRLLFRFAGDAIPAAALRHHVGSDDAGMGTWLAADPAFVRSEATGARLMAWPVPDLPVDVAEQLAAALRPLFGDAGAPLAIDAPSAWCLHLPGGTPMAGFVRPGEALGVDLLECLPSGEAGRTWRRLFNEAQVALHAHPVNAARVAAGQSPVNALWFWGAGALPDSVATELALVASEDRVLQGLAKAARIECSGPATTVSGTIDDPGRGGDALLDLDAPGHPGSTSTWLGLFQQWLRERRFAAIELTFASGDRFQVRHAHRLRFWRRG